MNDLNWNWDRIEWRRLLDAAPFVIWVTGDDGSCRYINPKWTELTGQSPQDAIGFGWAQVLHPDDVKAIGPVFSSARERRDIVEFEYRLRVDGDGYRWMGAKGQPLEQLQQNARGYIGTAHFLPIRPTRGNSELVLTPREIEILEFTAIGKTSEEVARILGISARTVEAHLSHIMAKTNAVNKVQAVVEAIRSGQLSV